ncbi:MAG: type I methionyl aminopeptidase [Gemmatimonadaceae bacterium]|nr:type I methionyl aminopeptidase [Gemmatimonadaceae bacterium]
MTIRTEEELTGMRRVGALVARTLNLMSDAVRPGVTTAELDAIAEEHAVAAGARSAPRLTYDFPGFTCISVNDEIVHGIPGARVLADGDLVTLDVTLELDGFMADSARTVAVGAPPKGGTQLLRTAREALEAGLAAALPGRRVRDVGAAIDRSVRANGGWVFKELCGHGIGRKLHEEPSVPNWDDPDASMVLHEGLVLAVEPMLAGRVARIVEDDDGWTYRTHNGALAVHMEHTVVVRAGGVEVLTTV